MSFNVPSSSSSSSSIRKRALALTPSLSSLEPPSQRSRTSTASRNPTDLVLLSTSTSTSSSSINTTQLETIQAELDHERSLRALDQKQFAQIQSRLERQVEFAVEEAKDTKAILEELKEQSEEYAETLRRKQLVLQNKLSHLENTLHRERIQQASSSSSVANGEDPRLEARAQENQALQETIQQLQDQVERLSQARERTTDDENNNAVLLQQLQASSPAPLQVMKELNTVRIQLAESERKNRQIKRQKEELQKKAKELLQQQERVKASTARTQQLELHLQERDQALGLAQAQLASWNDFGVQLTQILAAAAAATKQSIVVAKTDNSNNNNIPPEISVIQRYLQEATRGSQQAQAKNKHLETRVEKADEKIQDLETKIRELDHTKSVWNMQLQDANKRMEVAEKKVYMLQGQEAVWKRELATLRSIIKTFDELPLPGKTTTSTSTTTGSGALDNAKLQLIQASLDAAMEELGVIKEGKKALEKDIDQAFQAKTELQTKHNQVMEKFAKLQTAVHVHRAKAEKAEARAVHAETLAGKGAFNPTSTRVVHLQHNPLTEALKQEVSLLRRQVETLTASNTNNNNNSKKPAAGATPSPDVDPNKLHQRLKESFKEQIGRFREGVYLLTGFKIDMIPDGERPKFKVRSMFAEREQDHLMFQWPTVAPVEGLDLLDTELAKILMMTPSYEYVKRFGSMPAFLASTQLSLFETQTMI